MNVFRLGQQPHIASTAGLGGLYSEGRWHKLGSPVLYTSAHLSLAKLEVLANAPALPEGYFALTLEIPDTASIKCLEVSGLPSGWKEMPYSSATMQLGETWLREGRFWLLRVPSAQSPTEYNYLLNPLHPEHKTLRVVSLEPHPFDTRLKPPAATAAPAPPGSAPPPARQS